MGGGKFSSLLCHCCCRPHFLHLDPEPFGIYPEIWCEEGMQQQHLLKHPALSFDVVATLTLKFHCA